MAKAERGIDSVLGKQLTEYKSTYDPDILAREPRAGNREQYRIWDDELPFVGFDTWRAWEISMLTDKGLPVNGTVKLIVPASSPYLVESKSLKLYFFSFNMERMGPTKAEAIERFEQTAIKDISAIVGAPVQLKFWDAHMRDAEIAYNEPSDLFSADALESLTDLEQITFDTFAEDPNLLKEGEHKDIFLYSDLLRSNCKITNQADFGTVFIHMKGDTGVALDSLAKYIVSFRNENHFHEEIVECLYKRLLDKFNPTELMVTALYTRRGGIDINPVRATDTDLFPTVLGQINLTDVKDYRQ